MNCTPNNDHQSSYTTSYERYISPGCHAEATSIFVCTEHQLLGLLRQEEGLANQVLIQAGVALDKAREMVKQVLAEQAKGDSNKS